MAPHPPPPPQEGVELIFFFFFGCKFLKILMVSDKTIHEAFRIHKTLQTKPISDFLFFTSYQNYTTGFKIWTNDVTFALLTLLEMAQALVLWTNLEKGSKLVCNTSFLSLYSSLSIRLYLIPHLFPIVNHFWRCMMLQGINSEKKKKLAEKLARNKLQGEN